MTLAFESWPRATPPNTPGLRDLQEQEALTELLRAIGNENQTSAKPILLKIAPDITLVQLDQIITTCERYRIAAIIATNTTLDHSTIQPDRDETGGLSGAPLRVRSTELIRAIKERTQLPVIGVGGVMDAESAREKFAAGATLLQVYTGYVYRGPRLLRELTA